MAAIKDISRFLRTLPSIATSLARMPAWARSNSPYPDKPHRVPDDFFGICVAPCNDPAGDDFILARIDDLGLRQVRLDFSQTSFTGPAERLLQRLMAHPCEVCIHLVPLPPLPGAMQSGAGMEEWRAFLAKVMEAFGGHAEFFEAGSTSNRRAWAGFGPDTYLRAWSIAHAEARNRNIRLAGPNVTDFEPVYNTMYLAAMRAANAAPALHTTNLFVERATEPEAYDHKVLGRRLAGLGRFTMVRKARLLKSVGAWNHVPAFYSTHVSWSLRRIARFLPDVEAKQADYVARYCLLAAASGALERMYWGPLIGQREGLIDDDTDEFPEIPHVTFYGNVPGRIEAYRIRPAFRAFQTVNRLISGSTFKARLSPSNMFYILEFETKTGELLHAVWTKNARSALLSDCYDPMSLAAAKCLSRDGIDIPIPPLITETPFYLIWQNTEKIAIKPDADIEPAFRCHAHGSTRVAPFATGVWRGFRTRNESHTASPEGIIRLCLAESDDILRDSRNTLWRAHAPWNHAQKIVVKRFRPSSGLRKILQAPKPNRARRSWNGAQELMRRGVPTPAPVAFMERAIKPKQAECFYLCEAFEGFSAREAFTAFRYGKSDFAGFSQNEFFAAVSQFLAVLHGRGVFFRDLSAGNLLWKITSDGKIEFALIDTTRAKFEDRPMDMRRRLLDLMRLCHPLHKAGRNALLSRYLAEIKQPKRAWMRLPFIYYDNKHRLKRLVKFLRPSSK